MIMATNYLRWSEKRHEALFEEQLRMKTTGLHGRVLRKKICLVVGGHVPESLRPKGYSRYSVRLIKEWFTKSSVKDRNRNYEWTVTEEDVWVLHSTDFDQETTGCSVVQMVKNYIDNLEVVFSTDTLKAGRVVFQLVVVLDFDHPSVLTNTALEALSEFIPALEAVVKVSHSKAFASHWVFDLSAEIVILNAPIIMSSTSMRFGAHAKKMQSLFTNETMP